jgi:hypothetical protein
MTIHLPPDVEKSLMAKVRSGVFPSLDVAMTEAAHLLLEQIEPARPAQSPTKGQRKRRAKPPQKAAGVEAAKEPPISRAGEGVIRHSRWGSIAAAAATPGGQAADERMNVEPTNSRVRRGLNPVRRAARHPRSRLSAESGCT